ncbi:unnamed protein product [Nesidiocoris tenuis]|uniref:Uncharacterized protein n=1 Tax=Nesidiocoris tenuis TaxID=355587 RepID=A0A6H5G6K5_9HEMI|nr:unnamed protein product [Nesidiocoris tenuis]
MSMIPRVRNSAVEDTSGEVMAGSSPMLMSYDDHVRFTTIGAGIQIAEGEATGAFYVYWRTPIRQLREQILAVTPSISYGKEVHRMRIRGHSHIDAREEELKNRRIPKRRSLARKYAPSFRRKLKFSFKARTNERLFAPVPRDTALLVK